MFPVSFPNLGVKFPSPPAIAPMPGEIRYVEDAGWRSLFVRPEPELMTAADIGLSGPMWLIKGERLGHDRASELRVIGNDGAGDT